MITLVDGDKAATYNSVLEAVEGAKSWYKDLAGDKLPAWDYDTKSFFDFLFDLEHYKLRLAHALGYVDDFGLKLRLAASETKWTAA